MAKRKKKTAKKAIESYDHKDKKRANNPPVGLAGGPAQGSAEGGGAEFLVRSACMVAAALLLARCASAAPRIPPWVPPGDRDRVDVLELAPLTEQVEAERRRLERDLGVHVAAYRAEGHEPAPRKAPLCSLFEPADLTAEELRHIRDAEARTPGIVFVAYTAPLRRRGDRSSGYAHDR